MRTTTLNIEIFAAASASLIVCATAAGQIIIPIDQSRFVSNEQVNAPQCGGDFLFDGDAAVGFEPFDAFVQTQHGCDSGFAGATAGQQSQIDSASITASGTATSEAHGPVPAVVHAFGICHFEVTFELPSLSSFALDGTMTAGSLPDANVGAIVLARLWEGRIGGVLLYEQSVEPPPGGGINKQILEAFGTLEPGVYTVDVQAGSFIDNEVPPSRSAQASFDFTFEVAVACPWDLSGDGIVGSADLLALLIAWGPNKGHPADFNGDGTVGSADLLTLLVNWGPCP